MDNQDINTLIKLVILITGFIVVIVIGIRNMYNDFKKAKK